MMDVSEFSEEPAAKQTKYDVDINLCIICQKKTAENLVQKPAAHEKLLQIIEERFEYGDGKYPEIYRRITCWTKDLEQFRKSTWHSKCYKETVHVGMIKRAKERYEKLIAEKQNKRSSTSIGPAADASTSMFTRSQSVSFKNALCFFCEGTDSYNNPLHKVVTDKAGKSLKMAVEMSKNQIFAVKLATAINPEDAHAIDIRYHTNCWNKHVINVLRVSDVLHENVADEVAAKIEFLSFVEEHLMHGNTPDMSTLQELYAEIRKANNVKMTECSRRTVKRILEDEIPEVEFHRAKRVNEPDRVSIKKTRDVAIQLTEEAGDNDSAIRTLYAAASLLRKAMKKCKSWQFTGSLDDTTEEHMPKELYSFFRWVIQGPKQTLSSDTKTAEVDERAMSLAQNTMAMFLSDRQVGNKQSKTLRFNREMPQKAAVGLAIHQATRSKKIIGILNGFGISIEYNRLLRIEKQIAESVIERMAVNNGLFIPPDIIYGRHIFFAVDNVDFSEDTPDGKRTLHATAMAIYQRKEDADTVPQLKISGSGQSRSLKDFHEIVTALKDCPKLPRMPQSPTYPSYDASKKDSASFSLPEYTWLFAKSLSRVQNTAEGHPDTSSIECLKTTPAALGEDGIETDIDGEEVEQTDRGVGQKSSVHIPVWSGYQSKLNPVLRSTRIGAPPLLDAPAHEWATLLTILKQAQGINVTVMGSTRKTVVSLDMGLYKPAKQLQMARKDLDNLILRPGELHIVMAQLKTIGAYIENSGIDLCWIEADIYGSATAKQIIDGNHVTRAQNAHMVTLDALFMMYQEAFFEQHPDFLIPIQKSVEKLDQAFGKANEEDILKAQEDLTKQIESLHILEDMEAFNSSNANKPMFCVIKQYMQMVLDMMAFVRAVRTGNWESHLQALEVFAKFFFAHDRLNYARMIPLYLAEMKSLEKSDPEIYREFQEGNWVVNKNSHTAFCALGADHALEQINRSMKVSGGLIGITLNPGARAKFFLISPEMARLASEAQHMAGCVSSARKEHHALSATVLQNHENSVLKLTATMKSFTNPFSVEGDDLFNLVTKSVMPENVKQDVCNQGEIGQEMFDAFVAQRIKSSSVNLWAPMKKRKLATWTTTLKKTKISAGDKVVELKQDRSLFARLLVVCKARPNINLEDVVGRYELSVVPRSMFAPDGAMLHSSTKSNLMEILEKLPGDDAVTVRAINKDESEGPNISVSIVDAMAEVQALTKPKDVRNCSELAQTFTERILQKYCDCDELRLIFDRYDVESSLKLATREKRQEGQPSIAYHISDTTNIASLSMKKLLSHSKTKHELTIYLGEKLLTAAAENRRNVVVASGSHCQGTHRDMSYLDSNQEEADTKLLLHALDATASGATTLQIHSPDTDVFVLALRRYPDLCQDTSFVTGTGQNHRVIPLRPIVEALGSKRTAALPAFHAFSGADNTGSFAGKAKLSCWKAFAEAQDNVLSALESLGTCDRPADETFTSLEKFVCQIYLPNTPISQLKDLRWLFFKKKQAESERLPPTSDALAEAILRTHYQLLVWNKDRIANPSLPSPEGYGWKLEGNEWKPVMTKQLPAPHAVIHLVKCGCKKSDCSTGLCSCRSANLNCTDLCGCSESEVECENTGNESDRESVTLADDVDEDYENVM